MENILENLKKKKIEIIPKEKKSIFVKIENIKGRTIYHTKIMSDLYAFGGNKNHRNRFFISFRGLFNREKIEFFYLFAIKESDKFLGIYYGYRNPIKNVLTRYRDNGITKAYIFSKAYYIEFRFKKGSVFCYLRGISYLLRKDKIETKYCRTLLEIIQKLEMEVYEFYNEKLSYGGFITKWIEKNQK
ncbi:DUF226 domain-containing protein (plasmid) [Borrelia anserina]|uniref:Cytosolic protein n=2 Tax=Borrelia anserina TaxID=143 RepID=A0ABN4UHU5_BORAN|nr:DUF226 domain-containing protein [Borrelia anserina]AHH09038.1 Putative cytosolic protein [Borrelia anserina BA2]APR65433.1 hypothetical protein N187_J09 [Borrelia anserina Es]UPA07261.1 DUF226 domain-containing protein [Borrelia anserina]